MGVKLLSSGTALNLSALTEQYAPYEDPGGGYDWFGLTAYAFTSYTVKEVGENYAIIALTDPVAYAIVSENAYDDGSSDVIYQANVPAGAYVVIEGADIYPPDGERTVTVYTDGNSAFDGLYIAATAMTLSYSKSVYESDAFDVWNTDCSGAVESGTAYLAYAEITQSLFAGVGGVVRSASPVVCVNGVIRTNVSAVKCVGGVVRS